MRKPASGQQLWQSWNLWERSVCGAASSRKHSPGLRELEGHHRYSLDVSGKWWDIGTSNIIHHFHPPCLAFFRFSYILSWGKPILGLLPHHKVMSACVSTENWQLAMDLYTEAMQSTMRSVVVFDECFAWEGWQPKQLEIRNTLAWMLG